MGGGGEGGRGRGRGREGVGGREEEGREVWEGEGERGRERENLNITLEEKDKASKECCVSVWKYNWERASGGATQNTSRSECMEKRKGVIMDKFSESCKGRYWLAV